MARALGLEQALEHGNRVGRSHADRLVENHPAMNVALVATRLVVLARLLGVARIVVAAALIIVAGAALAVAGATFVVASAALAVVMRFTRKNIFFSVVRDRQFAARSRPWRWANSSLVVRIGCEVSLHRRCSQ